jgi:competence protein ComEC
MTAPVEIKPEPEIGYRTKEIMPTEEDKGKLVFRFLDMPAKEGQLTGRTGDAIYITFPNGDNMLVDSGSPECEGYLDGILKQMGVTELNYVVATHYHSDHIGNTYKILNKYAIVDESNPDNKTKLLIPGFDVPDGSYNYYTELDKWIHNSDEKLKVEKLWRGTKFNVGDVNFEVINPFNEGQINSTTDDTNNNSIVMKITYGENTALLAADIYQAAEMKLLETDAEKLKVDLLKVPHHGDTTSSDPEFVAAVSPKIAVITHFSDTVIVNNRYKSVGADTYVTGVDGIIKVAFDGKKSEVMTERYEISLEGLSRQLNTYIKSGDIEEPMAAQLANSLMQAAGQREKEHLSQAVKHMEDFMKHLENDELNKFISPDAKANLRLYAQSLINSWGNVESN